MKLVKNLCKIKKQQQNKEKEKYFTSLGKFRKV